MTREELKHKSTMCGWYWAEDADSVMDAMEQRIKELEKQLEDVQNTMATENTDLGMENYKQKERIKELEASQPKWISVEDRLPNKNEDVLCEDLRLHWWSGHRWGDNDSHTHWMPLPSAPKSED